MDETTLESLRAPYQRLYADMRCDGKGIITVFSAAHSDVGTSFVTRAMAMHAAKSLPKDKQVLLIDMDIQKNAQSAYFFTPENQSRFGHPHGPYDASLGQIPFWRITPSIVNTQGQNVSDAHYMHLYTLEGLRLAFTHFHWESLRKGQNVHIQNVGEYWHVLRAHYGAIFVDMPALDRSDYAQIICPLADQTVLIASPDTARSPKLAAAYTKIKAMQAQCAGVIINECPTRRHHYSVPPS